MPARPIVLDANILIRFVLGEKVPALLTAHAATIDFLAPDTAFDEARKHLPAILRARGGDGTAEAAALDELDAVTAIVTPVPVSSYEQPRADACACTGTHRPTRPPRLARAGLRAAAELPRLDRGPRLLRHRRRYVDDLPGRAVLHRTRPGTG